MDASTGGPRCVYAGRASRWQAAEKARWRQERLEAIGNRKIGGKGFGNWYSLESEIALGRDYAQAVESRVKLLHDPVISEYVNRIGQNLVRNSDAKVPFTIKVIDSDEINAFALKRRDQ